VQDVRRLAGLGVGSVKIFTTYLDTVGLTMDRVTKVLHEAAAHGPLVLVHAETDVLIQEGIAREVGAGNLGPRGHLSSRSARAEADAIAEVGAAAAAIGATVYFVHVSSKDGVEAVGEHKRLGRRVLAETCMQYLFLDDSVYDRLDGELWICSPPIRSTTHQAALWNGLVAGILDAVSTDHNCFDSLQKSSRKGDFRDVPNGLPGVELR